MTARIATTSRALHDERAGERQNHGRIDADQAGETQRSRPQQRRDHGAEQASLTRPLAKFASACLENIRPSPAAGEIRANCGLQRLGREHDAMLDHVAGNRGKPRAEPAGCRAPPVRSAAKLRVMRRAPDRRSESHRNWRAGRAASPASLMPSGWRTPSAPACRRRS